MTPQETDSPASPFDFDVTKHYYTFADFPVELSGYLKTLKDDLYTEARLIRNRQIPMWRRNEAFWKGIQRGIFSAIAHDYITLPDLSALPELSDIDFEDFERVINIYRAHGEAIIAALSANLPVIKFSPEDADNADDITTAKGSQKVAELIHIYNNAVTKVIKGLYHLYNHGIAFSYNIYNRDKKFGIIRKPLIDSKTVVIQSLTCSNCGESLDDQGMQNQGQTMMGQNMIACPICQTSAIPLIQEQAIEVPYIHSWDESPKGRSLIEIYGPLHVTVPFFSRNLDGMGYLRLDTDIDTALIKEIYPGFEFDEYPKNQINRVDRTPADQPFYEGQNLSTCTRLWFRPWMFNRIKNTEAVQALKQAFPNGVYTVWINEDKIAEACDESLDDCWSVTESPTSEYIHDDPIGNPIIPIQRMTNDLVNLTIETIETGVPINFADPQVVNLEELANHPANPGDFIAAKARSGMGLDSAFYTSKPSNLSQEVGEFNQYLTEQGQFVLGSFPSIFGGNQDSGSRTLGEYTKSQAAALQRLGIKWKSIAHWWGQTIKKSVALFRNNMIEDEHFSKPMGAGYINVWIRQAELTGKIGDVIVENVESLPIGWDEQRKTFMQLIEQNNPQFNSAIYHPENLGYLWNILGLNKLYIPGDTDRDKQLKEIFELMSGAPQQMPNQQTGQMTNQPSVAIEPEFDNHQVHVEVIRAFMVSEVGQSLKQTNPGGYANIQAHFEQHNQILQQNQNSAQKPPSVSINYKDLPPDGQAQAAKEAGININPQELQQMQSIEAATELVKHHMTLQQKAMGPQNQSPTNGNVNG